MEQVVVAETTAPQAAPQKKKGRPRKGTEKLGCQKIDMLVRQGIQSPIEIAEKTGVTRQAAQQQLSKYIRDYKGLEDYKKNRADILAEKQREVLTALCPSDIKKASAKDKAMVYGILYDKERLERGESTSNVAGIVKVLQAADSVDKTHQQGDK